MIRHSCPSNDRLAAFARGDLPIDDAELVISHVDGCTKCQDRFAELDSLADSAVALLPNLDGQQLPTDSRPPSFLTRLLLRNVGQLRHPSSGSQDEDVPEQIGQYSLVRKIASGGMGTVYEVRHINLARSMALKLIGKKTLSSRAQAEQVLREWRAHGRLNHPVIVSATDAGMMGGRPYLVTELVDGLGLDEVIRNEGPLHLADACRILLPVMEALTHAHQRGIAHLDIKPSNIMLTSRCQVRLLDWGTAAIFEAASLTDSAEDLSGSLPLPSEDFGTAGFIAPERLVGAQDTNPRDHEDAGFAADVYSLGCTMEYLLTGKTPTGPTSPTIDSSHLTLKFHRDDPASPAHKLQIQTILNRMLERDPAKRLHRISDYAPDFEQMAVGSEIERLLPNDTASSLGGKKPSSGDTVQVSQLLKSTTIRRRYQRRMWVLRLAGAAIVLAAFLLLLRPERSNWSEVKLSVTELASQVMSMWRYVPKTDSGFLFGSRELYQRSVAQETTVTHTTINTVAPRHVPTQVAVSPDGTRIVVETRGHETRLYGWDGRTIELQTIISAANARDRTRAVVWHPNDGSLIGMSSRYLAIVDAREDGSFAIDVQDCVIEQPESVHAVVDEERVLAVVVAEGRALGWDLKTRTLIDPITPIDTKHFTATNRNSHYAFALGNRVHVWKADANGRSDAASWSFDSVQDIGIDEDSTIHGIEFNREGDLLAVRLASEVLIFDWSRSLPVARTESDATIEPVATIKIDESWNPEEPFGFVSSDPIEIYVRDDAKLRCRGVPKTTQDRPGDHWISEFQGQRLMSAMVEPHPNRDWLVIAMPGGLEIWDRDGVTLDRVPAVEPIVRSIALPFDQGSLLLRTDGGGIVLDDAGQVMGSMLAPVDPAEYGCRWIHHCAIDSSPFSILQSNDPQDDRPLRRSVSRLGISRPRFNQANSHDIDAVFKQALLANPDRVVVNEQIGKGILLDVENQFQLLDLDHPDTATAPVHAIGLVGNDLAITADETLSTLFSIGKDESVSSLVAVDTQTGNQKWRLSLPSPPSIGHVNRLADGRLLVTNWFGSWVCSADDGDIVRDLFPTDRYGFHHANSNVHPISGSLHTWHVSEDPEPLACWTPELDLRWMAFATGSDQWIVLSPEGRVLTDVRSPVLAKKRFIGTSEADYRPAEWHPSVPESRRHPLARESLTTVRFHGTSRISVAPLP